jgi:mannan endo-1,4-beta-mannosidase
VTESNNLPEPEIQWGGHRRTSKERKPFGRMAFAAVIIGVVIVVGAMIVIVRAHYSTHKLSVRPGQPVRYVGVFEPDAPASYADIDQFARAIGRQPNVVPYYSHWLERFDLGFATSASRRGATTLVQIAPKGISLASIAHGRYDSYLRSYALSIKAFGGQVILSFGHEMNGSWYTWGYRHTRPAVFVAAWRHIVTVFRDVDARNVTWMWTINIIGKPNIIPAPSPWWPGNPYVNWVGIDGYYWSSSSGFASVFGPTIADVRELTSDPILIAETGAQPSVGQPAKIADLFAGVHTFGLLGFVYFNDDILSAAIPGEVLNWRLKSPAALAAFRQGAEAYMKPQTKGVKEAS